MNSAQIKAMLEQTTRMAKRKGKFYNYIMRFRNKHNAKRLNPITIEDLIRDAGQARYIVGVSKHVRDKIMRAVECAVLNNFMMKIPEGLDCDLGGIGRPLKYELCPEPAHGFDFNQQLFKERNIMTTKTDKQTVTFVEALRTQHAKLEIQATKQKELQNTAMESIEKAEIKVSAALEVLNAARLKSTACSTKIKSLKGEQHKVIDTLDKLHRTI